MNFKNIIENYEKSYPEETYILKKGSIPIILTAPHTMEQTRPDGTTKFPEPYTKAIAMYVADYLDCSYYIKLKDTGIDSNSSIPEEFKETLAQLIKENKIILLIDLHGAAREREFEAEFGTLEGKTLSEGKLSQLAQAFNNNGITKLAYNDPFKGGGITKYIYSHDNIDIVQIELNYSHRDINRSENIKKVCDSLIEFISNYLKNN